MERATIDENRTLEKDFRTKAVLSKDKSGYRNALARRRARLEKKNEINNLKDEIEELKNLVKQLIEKDNNG